MAEDIPAKFEAKDITFKSMNESEASKEFVEDGYNEYQKRSMRYGPNLSKDSIWATSPATMFVAYYEDTPVGVVGFSKYKKALLGAGIHIRKGYRKSDGHEGLADILLSKLLSEKGSKTLYINLTNPRAGELYRNAGFKDMKVESLPKEIQEELEGTNYSDQVQKFLVLESGWWGVVKEPTIINDFLSPSGIAKGDKPMKITNEEWKQLISDIKKDKFPKDRKKYFRFSNLDDINRRMVIGYLKRGWKNPKKRELCRKGIYDEMDKNSSHRGYLEDRR